MDQFIKYHAIHPALYAGSSKSFYTYIAKITTTFMITFHEVFQTTLFLTHIQAVKIYQHL